MISSAIRRVGIPRITLRNTCATSLPAASTHIAQLSSRHFAATAAPTSTPTAAASPAASAKPARQSKSAQVAAAAAAAAAAEKEQARKNATKDEALFTAELPEKPSKEELDALCLDEVQLRFARRPRATYAHRYELLPSVYVQPGKNILTHTHADVGKYYKLTEEQQKEVGSHLQRSVSEEMMATGGYMMVREPGYTLVQKLKTIYSNTLLSMEEREKIDRDNSLDRLKRIYGIRGSTGCGKSAALHYAVQYAREQNKQTPLHPWLIITTRGEEFTQEKRGRIVESSVRDGKYDQALYTADFFANMLKTESAALEKIKLKTDMSKTIDWSPVTETEIAQAEEEEKTYAGAQNRENIQYSSIEGKTLLDLVTRGSIDIAQSPRILYAFTEELNVATEIPTLIAIDNLNVWDAVSDFVVPFTYNAMPARQLALVDAFAQFTKKPPVSEYTHVVNTRMYVCEDTVACACIHQLCDVLQLNSPSDE